MGKEVFQWFKLKSVSLSIYNLESKSPGNKTNGIYSYFIYPCIAKYIEISTQQISGCFVILKSSGFELGIKGSLVCFYFEETK